MRFRPLAVQQVDEVGAFDGDFGGVGGFFFNAGNGLVVVFRGQDGVGNRDVVVEADTGNACAGFVGNQLEMIGFAADDDTDGDQCVILVAGGHVLQHQRHFQRAGNGGGGDVFVGDAQFFECAAADFQHFAADFVGETRLYDADAQPAAVQVRSDDVHVGSFF